MPIIILTKLSRHLKKKKKVKNYRFSFLSINNFFSIPKFEIKGLEQNHIADAGL